MNEEGLLVGSEWKLYEHENYPEYVYWARTTDGTASQEVEIRTPHPKIQGEDIDGPETSARSGTFPIEGFIENYRLVSE